MSIIAISGKIGSGKDTVGKIIQIMTNSPHFTNEAVLEFLDRPVLVPEWKVKRFADTLKDIVCMLLGCTREELEDREFKEKELGEEWWYYKDKQNNDITVYNDFKDQGYEIMYHLIKLTPRTLLQLLGTECGRQIIHPNIWVNALMSEYKPLVSYQGVFLDLGMSSEQMEKIGKPVEAEYPDWIITDMRFPNELKAVEDKDGITIRVNRPLSIDSFKVGTRYLMKEGFSDGTVKTQRDYDAAEWIEQVYVESYRPYVERALTGKNAQNDLSGIKLIEHESETALDKAQHNHTIENDGTVLELIAKVREVLQYNHVID